MPIISASKHTRMITKTFILSLLSEKIKFFLLGEGGGWEIVRQRNISYCISLLKSDGITGRLVLQFMCIMDSRVSRGL